MPQVLSPAHGYCIVAHTQESAEARVRSQGRLHTFTRQLRHAILHNADVASGWRPAARMLDVKATLDKKLIDQSFASAATRVTIILAPHSSYVCRVCHVRFQSVSCCA